MHRFFVEESAIGEDSVIIQGNDFNHIANVLRMQVGEVILISDGNDREYKCEISEITQDTVISKIIDMNAASRELPIKVTIFQALPKGDKMEQVIQKVVELGAVEIVPVKTSRCIVKLDDKKAKKKVERWNTIAESAAKQSKRGIIPNVCAVKTYKEALDYAKDMDMVLIPYEQAENMEYTREVLSGIKKDISIGVFIGPEGGFSTQEVEECQEIGASCITLGKRILRTETAGMMIMSVLMYLSEE